MKINQLKVLGFIYQVIEDPQMYKKRNASATSCTNTLNITIDSSFPFPLQQESFIHEIIESLSYHLQLKLDHDTISRLSEGLFAIIKDNPELLNFLAESYPETTDNPDDNFVSKIINAKVVAGGAL